MSDVEINWGDFREVAFHPVVVAEVRNAVARAEAAAKNGAPVKTAAYRASIQSEVDLSGKVPVGRVFSTDPGGMAIEAYTGNMVRAARAARK